VVIHCEHVVGAVWLRDVKSASLLTVWHRELNPDRQRRGLDKLRRTFQRSRQWPGADLMIWGWSCGIPPGLFIAQLQAALDDPVAHESLPPFVEVVGRPHTS